MSKIAAFSKLIRLEHSLFALPFAYVGLFLSQTEWPSGRVFLWVTVAMVSLRTAGMCLNRLIDESIDIKNERTAYRIELIRHLSRIRLWWVIGGSILLFVVSCACLNRLCLWLSPIPIAMIGIYPHLKKITWWAHFFLGMILGIAPVGAWIAVRGAWEWTPVALMGFVMCWVSAFDIYYSLQDVDFDRAKGLKSIPVVMNNTGVLQVTAALHVLSILSLVLFGRLVGLGFFYWVGCLAVGALVTREHFLIRRFGLLKVNQAFFDTNAWVGPVILVAVLAERVSGA